MKRRTYLKATLAGVAATAADAANPTRPIVLEVDLEVAPAREAEMLRSFRTVFRPAAARQPGYIDVKMLKLRAAIQGAAPAARYRFVLTFLSEELRQKWVASAVHRRVWPTVENTLESKNYTVLLYDDATEA